MKTNQKIKEKVSQNFADACMAGCQKLSSQIAQAKDLILTEFREAFGVQEKLLCLALNEAEALAWQTEYPHLFFPTLATEKVQAATAWHDRQQLLHRPNPVLRWLPDGKNQTPKPNAKF